MRCQVWRVSSILRFKMSIFNPWKQHLEVATGCAKHGRAASWSFGRGIYQWDLEAYDSYDNPKHATVGQFLDPWPFCGICSFWVFLFWMLVCFVFVLRWPGIGPRSVQTVRRRPVGGFLRGPGECVLSTFKSCLHNLKRPETIRHSRASTNTSDISIIGFACLSWSRWTYPLCVSCRCFDGFNQLKKIVQTRLMGFTRGEGIHEKPQRHELYSCTGIVLAWLTQKLMVGKLNMIKSVFFFSTQFFIQSPESFSLKDTWFFQIVFHCFTVPQVYPIPC